MWSHEILMRRLITIACATSFLLCMLICAVWIRSYWAHDRIFVARPGGTWDIWSGPGELQIAFIHDSPVQYGTAYVSTSTATFRPADANSWAIKWGFGRQSYGVRFENGFHFRMNDSRLTLPDIAPPHPCPVRYSAAIVSCWLPAIAFAILPALGLVLHMRRRRRSRCGTGFAVNVDAKP